MRPSDLIVIGIIVIFVFTMPIERYMFFYKILKFRPKFIPYFFKIIITLFIIFIYKVGDYYNLITKTAQLIGDGAASRIVQSLIKTVDSEVLLALIALLLTLLTLFYTNTSTMKKNDTESIFKIIDLLENNINNVDKKRIDQDILYVDKNFYSIDLRRLFLLKRTIDNNRIKLINSLSSLEINNSEGNKYKEKKRKSIKKLEKLILDDDISYARLEKFMSLLIRNKVLEFKREPYQFPLITSYLTNKEFAYIKRNSKFFDIIKSNYKYILAMKNNWIDIDQINYIFNKISEQDQSLNYIFRIIHRAVKITNNSALTYKEKQNMIGIIRALIPDYLLVYIFYNCTYTKRGRGLAIQLIGTSFFGDDSDFNGKHGFSQHFSSSYLIFKEYDIKIMTELYANKKINPGSFSIKNFDKELKLLIDK